MNIPRSKSAVPWSVAKQLVGETTGKPRLYTTSRDTLQGATSIL